MSTLTGFVSVNLRVSEDTTRVVNQAHWRAKAAPKAVYRNAGAQPHMMSAVDRAEHQEPMFYSLLFSVGVPNIARPYARKAWSSS